MPVPHLGPTKDAFARLPAEPEAALRIPISNVSSDGAHEAELMLGALRPPAGGVTSF